jgi:glycosyltransferase involved in cell wall biosynthesis
VALPLRADSNYRPVVLPVKEAEAIELSVVMPCLNEAETLETCIRKAQRSLREANVAGEVVIADNGSSDGSVEIAERLGARVVHVKAKGYGNALMGGRLRPPPASTL